MSIVNDLLALSHVPRWGIVSNMRPQSVAEHTFRMLVIAMELANRMDIEVSANMLVAGLIHDGPESRTGDIPSTAKRKIEKELGGCIDLIFWASMQIEAAMTRDEAAMLALADKIEGCTYISKWGVGSHAKNVARICRDEVIDMARDHSERMLMEVCALLTEIEDELGR